MATILIVEDDALLLDALTGQLKQLDYSVCTASSVAQAMALLQTQAVDGIILDLGLPGADGMELLTWARAHIAGLPVLILTARDGVDDRVLGLNAGADDYLPKPFDLDELEARLRALVRRSADPAVAPLAPSSVQIGAIRYDKDSGALYLHGEVMELTPRELALMHALLAQPGHAVTKERLYELVFPGQLDVQYEAIEVVVYRLRKKLAGTGLTLMTLRGLGYLLRADT